MCAVYAPSTTGQHLQLWDMLAKEACRARNPLRYLKKYVTFTLLMVFHAVSCVIRVMIRVKVLGLGLALQVVLVI